MIAVVVGVFVHPKACPVCRGRGEVGLSPVGPVNVGGRTGGSLVWVASHLSTVAPCLHCQGGDLSRLLRVPAATPPDGAA